jgi:hypothetical protein
VAVVTGPSVLCSELTVDQLGVLASDAPPTKVSTVTRTANDATPKGGASN